MGNVINLKARRKRQGKAQERKEAAENAVRFGRSKAERAVDRAAIERFRSGVDQHKKDP